MNSNNAPDKIGKKTNLSTLMSTGQGLSGFAWPENCGDFDMHITEDGTWYYRNSPIGRKKLVQLFTTVLQRDEKGQYWLVTPAERGRVQVDDVPFTIVEMEIRPGAHGPEIHMRTNLDHWVRLDNDHALSVRKAPNSDQDRPYVHIRDGLDALVNRAVYYHLVEVAELRQNSLIIESAGCTFTLGTLEEEHDH